MLFSTTTHTKPTTTQQENHQNTTTHTTTTTTKKSEIKGRNAGNGATHERRTHEPRVTPCQSHRQVASLPISFSFSTQSSSAPLISSSRSHRTNDLVVSISSRSRFPWSFRSLSLPPSLSIWPNLYEECGSFEQIFVSLKCIYWNFCNKICLWFWFFTFSLWFLILLLLLLWWCGWWCFGGFPIVWWWVLCGWWWKIAFSKCYQTHKNIF